MQSESSRLFKSVTQLDIFYPAVALFVDVSNLDDLQAELEYRNPSLKKNPISIYTKLNSNIGHVKIFFGLNLSETMRYKREEPLFLTLPTAS
jgi:hypothetical protein